MLKSRISGIIMIICGLIMCTVTLYLTITLNPTNLVFILGCTSGTIFMASGILWVYFKAGGN